MSTGDIAIIITLAGFIWQVYKERRKPQVDQSEVDLNEETARKASAERRKMEDEITRNVLQRVAEDQKRMQDEITLVSRKADFFISFARDHWNGSRKLHAQVIKYEPPEFVPAEKFPTGPLQTGGAIT
ncbi:MAG TPA: hypothetical protein VII92_08290 [Anaerolineae bacterium]